MGNAATAKKIMMRGALSLCTRQFQMRVRAARGARRPSFCKNRSPRKTEGVGNAGCPLHPQPRVRMVSEAHERSHHRFTGLFPAFPHTMVLTAYFVLSPATNSSCHRHPRIKGLSKPGRADAPPQDLTPASGRQNHTASPSAESIVRPRAIRQLTGLIDPPCHPLTSPDAAASTASRPAFVTIAKRPSVGTGRLGYASDLGQPRNEIFLQKGLDRQLGDLPAFSSSRRVTPQT